MIMNHETLGRFFLHMSISVAFFATLVACAKKDDSDSLVQRGQIIGGGTVQIKDVQAVGGFLPNPSLLRVGAAGQPALVYRDPVVAFSSYDKVLLDPVTIWAAPDSGLSTITMAQRQALADTLHADLQKAIAARCQLVTTATPGTLRIRFALVDTKTPNATLNTIATYAPYLNAGYSLASNAFNKQVGYFAGTATVEAYATDATDGKLLWQGVDKRGGTTSMAENTLNTSLDVDHAFDEWANQLTSRLAQLGVCRKPI
jgi:hypothetical protein